MHHEPQERLGRRLFFPKTVSASKTKTAGNQTNTNADAKRSEFILHFDLFQNIYELVLSRGGDGSQGRGLNSVLSSLKNYPFKIMDFLARLAYKQAHVGAQERVA